MKILVTMYGINSPGGIINHNENLISGFKMQGHHVDFIELVWRTDIKAKTTKSQDGYEMRASDIPVHQGKGWLFPKKIDSHIRVTTIFVGGNSMLQNTM